MSFYLKYHYIKWCDIILTGQVLYCIGVPGLLARKQRHGDENMAGGLSVLP